MKLGGESKIRLEICDAKKIGYIGLETAWKSVGGG